MGLDSMNGCARHFKNCSSLSASELVQQHVRVSQVGYDACNGWQSALHRRTCYSAWHIQWQKGASLEWRQHVDTTQLDGSIAFFIVKL